MDIEIRRGLSVARALAGEHWQPLLIYIGMGVVLPFLLLASEPVLSMDAFTALVLEPDTFRLTGSIWGPIYLLGICGALLCGAMLALWRALLAEIREGYVAEIMYGLVAGAAYLAAGLLFYYLLGFLLSLPFRLTVGVEAMRAEGSAIAIARQAMLALLSAWFNARLCLIGPIMAETGRLEPISAFIESWRRTASSQRRLFAAYLAFNVVAAVLIGLLAGLHGILIIGGEETRTAAMAMSSVWLIFWCIYFLIATLIPAGLYRASEGGTPAEIFT